MSCMIRFKFSSKTFLWVMLQINAFSIYIFIQFCVPIHSRLVNAWRNVRDAEKNNNFFDANEVFRYVSRSLWGLWHFNAILTNLDPFHTIEQKRHPISMAIDFIKCYIYDERSYITLHQFSLLFCQMIKLYLWKKST